LKFAKAKVPVDSRHETRLYRDLAHMWPSALQRAQGYDAALDLK